MWPFKPKPAPAKPTVPSIAARGQPVHLNLAPSSSTAVLRSLHRMTRLIEHQAKALPDNVLEEAAAEFMQRRRTLAANGINVPSDMEGIHALIAEIEAKETAQ